MKSHLILILAAMTLSFSCDKPQSSNSTASPSSASAEEKLPEQQVADIVSATVEGNTEKVKSLLQTNPKLINAKFTSGGPVDGWPLIMIAARHGHKPIVELLLASGAKVDEENYSGETSLMYASREGHKEIVELLLKNHADANAKNDAGATALGVAKSSTKPDKDAIVDLLQKNGAKE